MDEQLQISFAEPHHLTSFLYPMLDLLKGNERVSIIDSTLYAHTQQPLRLIASDQVALNSTTDTPSEVTFFVINSATLGNSSPPCPLASPLNVFIHDVRAAQQSVGMTTLRLVTPRPETGLRMVRIQRDSYARQTGGAMSHSVGRYEIAMHLLITTGSAPASPPFLKSIAMLLQRSSLRAYKHVRFQLKSQNSVLNDGHRFMPERITSYANVLARTITAFPLNDLAQDDRDCNICRFPYGQTMNPGTDDEVPSEQPVALPCGHCFGRACILQWAAATNDNCPMCRVSCLTPAVTKRLDFGLDADNYYYPDDRYSAHENFERSCADLDDHDNEDYFKDSGPISWYRSMVLNRAFRLLLAGALLEDPRSTPLHLQAAHFPEMQVALQTLDTAWTRDQEVLDVSNADILRNMSTGIRKVLLDMASTPYFMQVVGSNERWLWDRSNLPFQPKGYPLRPGFEGFLYRMLIRAIHFEGDRACQCSHGFHQHCLRTYYNSLDTYERGDNGPGDS